MRILFTTSIVLLLILSACAPGTSPLLPTGVPPEIATGVAKAPELSSNAATIVAGAVQAVQTQAVTAGTLIPPAQTAAAEAVQEAQTQAASAGTLVPPAQTVAASALHDAQTEAAHVGSTAVPSLQTAVPAAQTAVVPLQTPLATLAALPGGSATPPIGKAIDVKITEKKIDMPATTGSGVIIFRVTNAGTTSHNFQIEGQGIQKKLDADLNPGETKTIQVSLSQGTYNVYCPLDDHRTLGEQVTLAVTP